jgi:integrase
MNCPVKARKRDRDGLHKRGDVYHCWLKVNGQWVTRTTGTSDYQEAKRTRNRLQSEADGNRLPNQVARWPFEKALELYLARRKQEVERNGLSESTLSIDKGRSGPLLKAFTDRVLDTFNTRDIERYQEQRLTDVSARTVNMEVSVLRGVLKLGKLWKRFEEDYQPLPEKQGEVGRALTDEEEKLLLDLAASKEEWQVAFYAAVAAANTTLRSGEIKKLRIRDVDLENQAVRIKRSKTDAGKRNIPLNGAALWAFTRLMERALVLGATQPDHYLLPFCLSCLKTGHPKKRSGYDPADHQRNWRTAWRALVKSAKCELGKLAATKAIAAGKDPQSATKAAEERLAGFRFHDMRHHCITKLAESGQPDSVILSIAGHVSKRMLDHYSHIRDLAKQKAVAAVESYCPGVARKQAADAPEAAISKKIM